MTHQGEPIIIDIKDNNVQSNTITGTIKAPEKAL